MPEAVAATPAEAGRRTTDMVVKPVQLRPGASRIEPWTSRPARSTTGRSRIRRPARSRCRSTRRRPSSRRRSASTRATTTRASPTRRGRRCSSASPRSRAPSTALAFSSGLGATTTLMHLLNPGDRVVAVADVYGGVYRMFSQVYEPKGYHFDWVPGRRGEREPRRAPRRADAASSGSRRRPTRC